jgi:hypothetical protein
MAQLAVNTFLPTDALIARVPRPEEKIASPALQAEWRAWQRAFQDQTAAIQEFFRSQMDGVADALLDEKNRFSFSFPSYVLYRGDPENKLVAMDIPTGYRAQSVVDAPVGWGRKDIRGNFRRRISQLDHSTYPGVAYAAGLLRYSFADQLINRLSQGAVSTLNPSAEFPEWVVIQENRLMVPSVERAEARIAAMRRYLSALALAISLAPYFYTSDAYQSRRIGMLVQLADQGRSLAMYQADQLIHKIRQWSAEHRLDRGLRLSVPYFDDQSLGMRLYSFEVIPVGRTPFIPAFLVLALERELARLKENQSLIEDTRIHLLSLLATLREAFLPAGTDSESGKEKL